MLPESLVGIAAGALRGLVLGAALIKPGLSSVDLAAGRFVAFGFVAVRVMVLTGAGLVLMTHLTNAAIPGVDAIGFMASVRAHR